MLPQSALVILFASIALGASLSTARTYFAAAGTSTVSIFGGGLDVGGLSSSIVDLFDATTGTWNSTAQGAGQLSQARYYLAASAGTSFIVFAGGTADGATTSTVVDVYSTVTRVWSVGPPLSVARMDLAAAGAQDLVIFAGGSDYAGAYYATVDILTLSTMSMNSTSIGAGSLSWARTWLAGAACESKFLFAGGYNGTFPVDNIVDIYDSNTKTWSAAAAMQGGRFQLASAAACAAGVIYFGGGRAGGGVDWLDIYTVASGLWSTGIPLSATGESLGGAASDNVVIFAGGAYVYRTYSRDSATAFSMYDALTGDSLETTPMATEHWFPAAAGAGGYILIGGGLLASGSAWNPQVEVYDVRTYTSTTTNSASSTNLAAALAVIVTTSSTTTTTITSTGAVSTTDVATTASTSTIGTATTPPAPPACQAGPAGGTCVNGILIYNTSVTTDVPITIITPIVVYGDLTIPNGVTITPEATFVPITVAGTATIGGVLTVVLTASTADKQVISLINATTLEGNFTSITIKKAKGDCNKVTGDLETSGGSLSVILAVTPHQCSKTPLSPAAIAGVAIGGVLAATIVGIVVILLVKRHWAYNIVYGKRMDRRPSTTLVVGRAIDVA